MFKIRASASGQIMTNARSKGETLSQTAKTYCENWLKEQIFGRKIEIKSKFLQKGIVNEQLSIDLINRLFDKKYVKNENFFENDFLTGTPDIIGEDLVIDIKNSWDISSFPIFEKNPDKNYVAQLQCYMHLTGKKRAQLIYTLTDMPDSLITSETYAYARARGIDYSEEIYDLMTERYTYMDIPNAKKIKVFDIDYDKEFIKALEQRVIECRNYIETLNF